MLKKQYLFLIIFVCFFAISAVSAEDNSTDDIVCESNDVNNVKANILECNMNSIVNDTDTLKVSDDELLTAGNIWYVNSSKTSSGDGKCEATAFKTLNEALNKASNDDTIMIASGEYKGHDNVGLSINKNLNFIKYGDSEAIFDAEQLTRIWTVTATSMNMTGLTFKNGRQVNGGGAAIRFTTLYNSNINGTFINNKADRCGGAIYIYKVGVSCNLEGIFINNTAILSTMHGGAIFIDTSEAPVNLRGIFINNEAGNSGGAFHVHSGISGNLSGIFINNSASTSGGAIYISGDVSYCNIYGSFINNTAIYNNGGAIRIYGEGDVNIKNTIFENNLAINKSSDFQCHGGAIYADGNVKIDNCSFLNNRAADYGGAIYADTVSINSASSFINNMANDNDGGAIYADNYVECVDSIFRDSSSFVDGGAIYAKGYVNIKNTTFENNKASGAFSSQCYGGAIRSKSDVKVDNCTFLNNNAADYGGAIYAETITWVYSHSYFIGNSVGDNRGGAIYTNKFTTDVKYGVFINNAVNANDDGGAIYINEENHVTFSQCYFENNRCGDEGGAIYLNDKSSALTLKSNVFVDNWAGDKGNIVYNKGYYDSIEYNWFGRNDFDFSNELVEYHLWTSDESHSDEHKLNAMIYMDDNVTIWKEANLTIYFSDGNTPGDLFMIDATFSANNSAVLSNWHDVTPCTYVRGITLANTNVTHITANVNHQVLELDVNPLKGNLMLNASADSIFAGDNATVVVNGLKNATGDVSVFANLTRWAGKIDNGVAKIIVSGLKVNATVGVVYGGDENYNPCSTAVDITVYPKSDVVLIAENVTKYYRGPERFVANVYDSESNPIANKTVSITINRITYTRITDENGTVSLAINLGSGTYEAITQVDSTSVKSSITVLSTVNGSDITKYYRNATQYSVQVYNANGTAVGKGEIVTFNINGIIYNRATDENGIATLNINLPPSEYIITSNYKGCTVANNIKVLPVLKAEDITMKYLDGTQFKANLIDGQGNPYKDQFVTFNVNGILYNKLTDSNGQAALNIRLPPGEYIITSSFNGANIANKITITD